MVKTWYKQKILGERLVVKWKYLQPHGLNQSSIPPILRVNYTYRCTHCTLYSCHRGHTVRTLLWRGWTWPAPCPPSSPGTDPLPSPAEVTLRILIVFSFISICLKISFFFLQKKHSLKPFFHLFLFFPQTLITHIHPSVNFLKKRKEKNN